MVTASGPVQRAKLTMLKFRRDKAKAADGSLVSKAKFELLQVTGWRAEVAAGGLVLKAKLALLKVKEIRQKSRLLV